MNIVFYSYKKSIHAHINDHELKRLDHSIRSLRDFNNEIEEDYRNLFRALTI